MNNVEEFSQLFDDILDRGIRGRHEAKKQGIYGLKVVFNDPKDIFSSHSSLL